MLLDRVDITNDIHNTLRESYEIVVLSGIGGIGKSTIALAYCNNPKFFEDYDNIAWVGVSNNIQLDLILNLSNEKTGFYFQSNLSDDENFDKLLEKLRSISGNNLLVIDNANDLQDILNAIKDLESLRWRVLVTSRTQALYIKTLSLQELEMEHCKELFYRYYLKEKDDETLVQLLPLVFFNTLLIELIAKVGKMNSLLNIKKLYDLIKKSSIKAPNLQVKIPFHATTKVEMVRLHGFIQELFQVNFLTDREIEFLRYFTIIPSVEIGIEDIFLIFGIESEEEVSCIDILNSLVEKGWIIQRNNFYKIHELIQLVLYEKLDLSSTNCSRLICSLNNLLNWSYGSKENFVTKSKFLAFAEKAWNFLVEEPDLTIADLGENVANAYNNIGRFQKILPVATKVLEIKRINLLEDESFKLASTYNLLGLAYWKLSNYREAESQFQLAVEKVSDYIIEQPSLYFDLCNYLNNLAIIEAITGKYYESKKYYERAIDIILDSLNDDLERNELQLAVYNANLALLYLDLKDFDSAKDRQAISLFLREKHLNENHPLLARTYRNMSSVYSDLNEINKAQFYIEKAMKINSIYFDEDNISWYELFINAAKANIVSNNFDSAEYFLEKALKCFEANHSERLHSYMIDYYYFSAQLSLKKLSQKRAEEFIRLALEIVKKMFGEQHPKFNHFSDILKKIQNEESLI